MKLNENLTPATRVTPRVTVKREKSSRARRVVKLPYFPTMISEHRLIPHNPSIIPIATYLLPFGLIRNTFSIELVL